MLALSFTAEKLFLLVLITTRQAIAFQTNIVFYEPNKYSVHAENEAIRKIKNKNILKHCKIFIGKITDGEITQALPCEMCNKLLKKYGVKKICCIDKI